MSMTGDPDKGWQAGLGVRSVRVQYNDVGFQSHSPSYSHTLPVCACPQVQQQVMIVLQQRSITTTVAFNCD